MTPADAASILPRKACECEFKAIDDATGSFTMYGLVFDNVDRQNDVIVQGAVQNIDEFTRDGFIALNHDQAALPVATIDAATQDTHGLRINGTFHSTPEAQAVRTIAKERMERGKSVKTSIGYVVPVDGESYEKVNGQTVRRISKMSVYEASFVNLPANPLAEVQSVKSLDGFDSQESEEEMSEQAVVKALKRMLGLETKSSYKVGGEDMERMKGLVHRCMSSAKSLANHHKTLKEASDENAAAHDELEKHMKAFEAGRQQDDDKPDKPDDESDTEEDGADEEDKPEDKKPQKALAVESEEEKTRKVFVEQLKRRALVGRRAEICP
jgi:HK97 family phage prohead protease